MPKETSAGETGGREALSEERLAHLTEVFVNQDLRDWFTKDGLADIIRELLAEVERLRALEQSYIVALDQANIGDMQRLAKRAETAERELDGMRAAHPDEWGVASVEGDSSPLSVGAKKAVAQASVAAWPGMRKLMHRRAASPWRVASEEGMADDHACDSCGGVDPGSCMTREVADGG